VSAQPIVDVLLIGDSISCGYALLPEEGGKWIPRGYDDAFPSAAMRLLRQQNYNVQIQTMAYPGIALVRRTADKVNASHGMVDKFFHASSSYIPSLHALS
jgi:hypothetical protein